MSPQESEPIPRPYEEPIQPELFPDTSNPETSSSIAEDEFAFESIGQYISAFRESRRQRKAARTHESESFRDDLRTSVEAKVQHFVNIDEPEAQTAGDKRLQKRVHKLLDRRSGARTTLAELEKAVPPHEVFHPYKARSFEARKRRAAATIRRTSAKLLREVQKSGPSSTIQANDIERPRASDPDLSQGEQLSLRFSSVPTTVHAKGELLADSGKKPVVFEAFLSDRDRSALHAKQFKEFEQKQKEKEERRKKSHKQPKGDKSDLREVVVPTGYESYFSSDKIERLDESIAEAIRAAAKDARIAAGDENANLPKEEFRRLAMQVQEEEVRRSLPDDAPDEVVNELVYALVKLADERGRISRPKKSK